MRNEWHVYSANKTQDLQLDLLRISSAAESMEDRTTVLDPRLPCAVFCYLHLCLMTAIKGRGPLPQLEDRESHRSDCCGLRNRARLVHKVQYMSGQSRNVFLEIQTDLISMGYFVKLYNKSNIEAYD